MRPSSTDTQQIERDIEQGGGGEASAEQAADLAALRAAAAVPDAAAVAGQEPEQGIQPPSAGSLQIAGAAMAAVRPLLCFALPSLRTAPDELWEPVPEGVAAILDHYDLGGSDLMRSPWARLAFALAPLAIFAAAESMKKPPEPEPMAGLELPNIERPPEPVTVGQKTVTFGAAA